MMRKGIFLLATVLMLAMVTNVLAQDSSARHASAVLHNPAGEVIGFARFVEDTTGRVHVNIHVKGISAGLHGTHFHAIGACSPDFSAAGGHHNPSNTQHGLENPNGPHAGDLPNLMVNAAGVGHLNTITDRVTLSAGQATLFDANGSALVIHADPDDQVTHPTGNSGSRIACGVISASH
jgi:Cu-Zn family superoxide dismutase